MADYYKLPDPGEGLTEAEIVTWRVAVGDVVKVNDVVVEVETAKSLVELPSPYAGTVLELLVPEGETVAVGTPIIAIGSESEAEPTPEPAQQPAEIDLSNPAASGGENQTLVGYGPREAAAKRRPRRSAGAAISGEHTQNAFDRGPTPAPAPAASEDLEEAVPAVPAARAGDEVEGPVRVLAKPPVRKLARDLGVDLRTLTPSGPHGTVSRADVEQAAEGTAEGAEAAGAGASATREQDATPARAPERAEREWREPIKGVRKMMGQAMTTSAFTAPHVTEWVTIDVTRTTELVERLRSRRELADVKISPLLVAARAVCLAVRRTPEVNSTWDDAAGEIVFKSYVNLGIAAATPRGLVVPNVKDADSLGLLELARALGELTATAREGRTQPADMAGGTITITNVGVFAVDAGTPIINPGESAILCLGAIKKQPWVVGESVVPRDVMTLALSFDHRHVDGEKGSRFLSDVASILEDPATALLF